MDLSSYNIKNFLYFLKFQETKTMKKFLIFQETSYILGRTSKALKKQSLLYFSKKVMNEFFNTLKLFQIIVSIISIN